MTALPKRKFTLKEYFEIERDSEENLNIGMETYGQWRARVRLMRELSSISAHIFESFFADVVVLFSVQT